jgi:hypothetical protein
LPGAPHVQVSRDPRRPRAAIATQKRPARPRARTLLCSAGETPAFRVLRLVAAREPASNLLLLCLWRPEDSCAKSSSTIAPFDREKFSLPPVWRLSYRKTANFTSSEREARSVSFVSPSTESTSWTRAFSPIPLRALSPSESNAISQATRLSAAPLRIDRAPLPRVGKTPRGTLLR